MSGPASAADARVVVLHGLWMTRHVMTVLVVNLRRAGFLAESWGYPSRDAPLEANAAALARHLGVLDARAIHVVAHSYGGVVTLRALAERADPRVRRVVLLGSPVAGSAAGAGLARSEGWRIALGHSARVWAEGPNVRVPEGIEVGSIAGTARIGLGAFVTRFADPNDGVVRVSETRLAGLADHLTLETSHSGMVLSGRVAGEVAHFLAHGRFRHGAGSAP